MQRQATFARLHTQSLKRREDPLPPATGQTFLEAALRLAARLVRPYNALPSTERTIGNPMAIVTQRDTLRQFERPTMQSWAQLLSTAVGLATGWILADMAMRTSLWLGAAASLVISVFSVRAFIIFHDCGHGSFSRSRRVNTVVGTAIGVVVLTPFAQWSRDHAKHHATSGDLDRRGAGDVWTMTTDEYRAASPRQRLYYRAYRNPVIMMSAAPLIKFLVVERFVTRPGAGRRHIKLAVYLTNVAIVGFVVTMGWWMAPGPLSDRPANRRSNRRSAGRFPVLCAAQFPGHILAPAPRVGLHRSRAGRQFPGYPAQVLPVGHREHRFPPHSPPRPSHPQLLAAESTSRLARGPARLHPYLAVQFGRPESEPLGRKS